jgi:sulfonate transport system substrate-binding protein
MRVFAVYEEASKYSLANYNEENKAFQAATMLSDAIADIQLKQRTDLNYNKIDAEQRDSILQAGLALQKAGIIKADVDVEKSLNELIDAKVAFTN